MRMGMLTHTENVDLRYWKMLTNFTEMVDTFPEKVDSCRSLFSRCAVSSFNVNYRQLTVNYFQAQSVVCLRIPFELKKMQ